VGVRGIVVGIDASPTGTGIVGLACETGECLAHSRLRPAGVGADRLVLIRRSLIDWLDTLVETHAQRIVHVCMENYAFGAKFAAQSTAEVGGVIKLTLLDVLGRPVGFPSMPAPGQVKKFATGSGTSAKDQVSTFVLKKWGVHMPNTDEADAYAAAQIARALVLKATAHQYEEDVITAMRKKSAVHSELPNEEKYALDAWR
jgi:Holliday junction resolvasome RuvABC endonuclease subunit